MNLRNKLLGANLLFKILFVGAFMLFTPYLAQRINLYQTDDDLVDKREHIIQLISEIGIEPFLTPGSANAFGSYNLLKEEFISISPVEGNDAWNYIDIEKRQLDHETISYRVLKYTLGIDGKLYLIEIGKSLSSITTTERNIRKISVYFLILFVSVSVLFELFYTDWLLRPLRRIIKKIKGTPTPSSYTHTPLNTSTSDFKLLDSTLIELMDKANRLLQNEKEITQNISHELLTPISILRGKLENLALSSNLDEDAAIKIEEALGTLHRLKTLVASLLMIARIESKQYLKPDNFEVTQVMDDVLEELMPLAEDAGVTLVFHERSAHQITSGNRSLIFSMFFNVINNAIKFTGDGGKVIIAAKVEEQRFVLSVTDTGIGIPHELKDSLFDRFKRKKNTTETGTGIGLAIVKSIADFHGIVISVTSTINIGSCFEFSFPLN